GLLDRGQGLGADGPVHLVVAPLDHAARVHHEEVTPSPVGMREVPVAGHPRPVVDDRLAPSEHSVEERRLPDVRAADDGHHRQTAAHEATSASIKSYPLRTSASPSASLNASI